MFVKKTFSQLKMLFFIAWRNIWRNPIRSALTIFSLSAGLALVLLYSAILEGMTRQMSHFATDISTGHMQVHREAYIEDQDVYATLPWGYLEALEKKFPSMKFSPRLYAAGLASTEDHSTGVFIKAVDPLKENQATKLLNQVREGSNSLEGSIKSLEGFTKSNSEMIIYPVLIGTQLAKNHNISPGDELILVTQAVDGSIGNAIFIVNGVFKAVDPVFDRAGVLMSIKAYQELMYLESGFHELVIKTPDVNDLFSVQEDIELAMQELNKKSPLDKLGGQAVVRNWREISAAVANMLDMSKSMIWVLGFIIVCLSSFGVLNTMLMAVHERRVEFGILLAIGMKARWILFMILMESLLLGLVASILGSFLGIALVFWLRDGIDFSSYLPDGYDFGGMIFEPVMQVHLEYEYIWMISLLLIFVTVAASLIPSWKTVKLKPVDVL